MDNTTKEVAGGPQSPFDAMFSTMAAAPCEGADVAVQALPPAGNVAVRGKPGDAAFLSKVEAVTGLTLPLTGGAVAEAEGCHAIWLGPDHWLIVCGEGEGPALTEKLQAAFEGLFAAAVDVSGARARLRITGPAAADLLATGCRLDLDPTVFGEGQSVQTPLGNVTAIIHRVAADAPSYDLYVPRSTAVSFWRWLEHAGREFGLRGPGQA